MVVDKSQGKPMNVERVRIFLDTEFTALRRDARLISLALVVESGEEFYAEFTDVPMEEIRGNRWIEENVWTHLWLGETDMSEAPRRMYVRDTTEGVSNALREWLAQFGERRDASGRVVPHLEMWADVPAYDWVFFAELFGGALHLPETIDYTVRDLATWLDCHGVDPATPRLELLTEGERPEGQQHNALFDARVALHVWKKISAKLPKHG